MNNKTWATVAPIGGFFDRPEAPNLPFYFSDDISLQLLPDWITSDNDLDLLRPRLRQAIKDKKAEYCLLVISAANGRAQLDQCGDAERAKRLFNVLFNAPQKGPLWAAVSSLGLALTQKEWILRYLQFWLALEALFGPDDAREITFRISQRIAFFLTGGEKSRREMFDDMKESYKWRSKIVHGVRISKLKSELSASLITILEDTARRSLLTILEDNALAKIFTGKGRERYLDDLVFERQQCGIPGRPQDGSNGLRSLRNTARDIVSFVSESSERLKTLCLRM